ncbi:MAG: ATP-grasp domain-containing protein [Myxococcota bacterium]
MKVLVTGAGALLGQGILRALQASSLNVELIAVDPSPLAAGLYWVDRAHRVPMARDPAYLDVLSEILGREEPDAVLIGTDVELEVLASHRHALEERFRTHIIVASPEVVAIADDKYQTASFLLSRGFAAPLSGLPGEEERILDAVGFPLVVKPRVGARSVGLSIVHDRAELDRAVSSLADPVIQEHVATADEEYTAGTLTFNGVCHASIVMRRDLRDGNTYRAFVEPWPELNAQVSELATALGAYGPANFQFRLDGDTVKVFEINARFSGTTPLRHKAGFPEVEMVLRHVVLKEPITRPPVEPMTLLRHWSETVVRPQERLAWDAR